MVASVAREQHAPAALKLLAHDLRWRLLLALSHTDCRVQELAQQTGAPPNLVSYHLRQLRDFNVVTERRSAADGRDVYYSLDLPTLHALYVDAGVHLHPALRTPELLSEQPVVGGALPRFLRRAPGVAGDQMPSTSSAPLPLRSGVRVLFLSMHNSARSQMAEAIFRRLANDQLTVDSAGSDPTAVDPTAIRVLAEMGIDISDQRAKHYSLFGEHSFSYVITLCDQLRERCPTFPGWPPSRHWSFPDPTQIAEGGDARYQAFVRTALHYFTRIRYFLPAIEQDYAAVALGRPRGGQGAAKS